MIPYAKPRVILDLLRKGQEGLDLLSGRKKKRSLNFLGKHYTGRLGLWTLVHHRENVQEGDARTCEFLEQEVIVLRKTYDKLAISIESMSREVEDLRALLSFTFQETNGLDEENARITTL